MLVAMPMIAGAAPVAGEPVAGNADSPTADETPKYALKGAGAGDEKAALASYVKGAYNAVIKGINNTQDEIDTLNSGIETYSDAIGHLTDGKATQDGTVATIKSATTNESIATSSVNFTGVTPTSISATASGNVNLSVPRMADWETDSLAETPVQTTASFSGLAVDNLTMSAPSSNTATLTKNNIAGTVNVAEYMASAAAVAPKYDYTPLISTEGNSFGYKTADGSDSGNADGLANGEWKTTWNSYGTAKGTTMCSSTGNNRTFSMGQTTTDLSTSGDTKSCWCKLTGFTDNNNTTYNDTSLWVFRYTFSSASGCAGGCAINCGDFVRSNSAMRSGLFGSVQQ